MAGKATLLAFDQSRPASANGACQSSQSLEPCNAVAETGHVTRVCARQCLSGDGYPGWLC